MATKMTNESSPGGSRDAFRLTPLYVLELCLLGVTMIWVLRVMQASLEASRAQGEMIDQLRIARGMHGETS